ncbi:hypothetical protein [Cohnella mopanensis]|uniref:hypothetical protein n=1 Tax=Cohnella mopanensis TaxID=2911966 RepID=UPI001EF8FA6D|nr:hypothetical protein [Cohnella mopanensis]
MPDKLRKSLMLLTILFIFSGCTSEKSESKQSDVVTPTEKLQIVKDPEGIDERATTVNYSSEAIKTAASAKDAVAMFEGYIPLLIPEQLDSMLLELEDYYRSDREKVYEALREANEAGTFERLDNPVTSEDIARFPDDVKRIVTDAIAGKYKFVAGEGVIDPILDYHALTDYKAYLSPAVGAYLELMSIDSDQEMFADGSIIIPWEQIGERALKAEAYLNEYPDSPRYERVKVVLQGYISSFFLGASNSTPFESGRELDPEVSKAFDDLVSSDGNSFTGQLTQEYSALVVRLGEELPAVADANNDPFYEHLMKFLDTLEGRINEQFKSPFDSKQVRFVYMSPPIPKQTVNTLYSDQNSKRVSQLLRWLDQADPIEGAGLTDPLHGRSMAVEIVYENGSTQTIRPAWRCSSTKDAQGNTGTDCKPVEDTVSITDSSGAHEFALSATLFEFVNKSYREWMPDLKPYEIPEKISLNHAFQVIGHGSLMEKMYVKLSKDNKVVWRSDEIVVDHGEYVIEGTLDRKNVLPGQYQVDLIGVPYPGFETVTGGHAGIGTSVEVVK